MPTAPSPAARGVRRGALGRGLEPLVRLARADRALERAPARSDDTPRRPQNDARARRLEGLAIAWQRGRQRVPSADCSSACSSSRRATTPLEGLECSIARPPSGRCSSICSAGEPSRSRPTTRRRAVPRDGADPRARGRRRRRSARRVSKWIGSSRISQKCRRHSRGSRLATRRSPKTRRSPRSSARAASAIPRRAPGAQRAAEIARLTTRTRRRSCSNARARRSDSRRRSTARVADARPRRSRRRGHVLVRARPSVSIPSAPAGSSTPRDYCVALGDTEWAKQLYRDARAADRGTSAPGRARRAG